MASSKKKLNNGTKKVCNGSMDEHAKQFNGQSPKARAPRLKIIPWERDIQDSLGDELVNWVLENDVLELEDFPISKSYHPTLFYRIAKENDYFDMCLGFSKWVISSRLQKKCLNKIITENHCFKLLPVFNEWYREMKDANTMADAKGREMAKIIIQQMPIETTVEVDEQMKKKTKAIA